VAISLSGGAYIAASLIRGLQSPAIGVAVIGAAAIRMLVALHRGHQARSAGGVSQRHRWHLWRTHS
jgi:hypothetical protein